MSHIRLAIFVVSLAAPTVATAADAGVYVYFQPLPPHGSTLTFTIASLSAVSSSGEEHPLDLQLSTVRSADLTRQRLAASVRLPLGSYTGFLFTIRTAALARESGQAALVVPEAPVRVEAPFVITGTRGAVVWLTLRHEASVTGGVGFTPVFSAAIPSRPIVDHAGFVSNAGSSTITVFDRNLTQAVAAIETCAGPSGMAIDRRRRVLHVACSRDDEVQSIDVATGEILKRTRVSPGDRPLELALTPDGNTLVSVNAGSDSVSFLDAVSLTRQERVNVGSGPGAILISPEGRRAFVFNTLSSSISVVDITARRVTATLATDTGPLRGQFNRRGDRLYVIHERTPYMTVLDARQLTSISRARLRAGVSAIALDTVRGLVCIGGDNDRAIEFFDPEALMHLYSMRIRDGVSYMAFDAEDSTLYLVSRKARRLAVGRLAEKKVVSEIDVGEDPYAVAVMGEQ